MYALKYVCVTLRSGHGGDVTDVAWSPDGTRIVTASIDNTAIIWNVRTGPDTKQCDSLALKSISPHYYTQHLPFQVGAISNSHLCVVLQANLCR